MTDLEPDVPEGCNKRGEIVLGAVREFVRQQQHDIDVRAGMQLATAVAAHGDQCRPGGFHVLAPQVDQDLIDQARAVPHQRDHGFPVDETLPQLPASTCQRFSNSSVNH